MTQAFAGAAALWPFRRQQQASRKVSRSLLAAQARAAEIEARNVHVVVLVHGYMGNPDELGYLEKKLQERADRMQQQDEEPVHTTRFLIHSATCNNGRTYDGIAAGGERVAEEVNSLLSNLTVTATNTTTATAEDDNDISKRRISLSFVGNSLGGLYARYALKDIAFSETVTPQVFCTTATPHLGVSQHTYLHKYLPNIPRVVERVVAAAMLPTGNDLFRFSTVLEDMSSNPVFLNPLRSFRTRLAYINAHHTDFQVPTATAAFLTPDDDDDDDDGIKNHRVIVPPNSGSGSRDFELVRVETVPVQQQEKDESSSSSRVVTAAAEDAKESNTSRSPLSSRDMARRLDDMGWTKVFCDVREHLWSVPLPFRNQQQEQEQQEQEQQSSNKPSLPEFLSSAELLRRYGGGGAGSEDGNQNDAKWYVPSGHTVLVANSKSPWYARLNAGGQPVMDQLAEELVDLILNANDDNTAMSCHPSVASTQESIATTVTEGKNEGVL